MAENIKIRLYSPLEFYLHDPREEEANGEYGLFDLHDERYKISHGEAWEHLDAIELAIRRDRDRMDATRGLAEYLPDELRGKVLSLFPSIEPLGNSLWCVAEAELTELLAPEEMDALKSWWLGNLSDGWGEGFEQRAIQVGREELYAVPWTPDDSFFVDTEPEFQQRLRIDPPAVVSEAAPAKTPAMAALDEPDASDDPATAALREQLINRLSLNLADYFASMQGMDAMALIDKSAEIGAICTAHHYLSIRHNFHASELKYLLQFKDPLQVVADQFGFEAEIEDHSAVMWDIFDRQDALQDGYELIGNVSDPSTRESQRDAGKKPSVLEQIRRGRQEDRQCPPTSKNRSERKKSGPEL